MNLTKHMIPSINISILEKHLSKCNNFKKFDQILCQMITTSLIKDTFACSKLFKFATTSDSITLHYTARIFDHIDNPNGFIYNTMMKVYLHRNSNENVISLYRRMLGFSIIPDNYTHPIVIQACSHWFSPVGGKQLHGHVIKMGFECDVYVSNTLINMYAVCGCVGYARQVFDESPVLDLVSWNTILAAYVQRGDLEMAKELYDLMPRKNVIASNSMIVLLGRLGRVGDARVLFDAMPEKDLVSWGALVSCYEQNRLYLEALFLFKEMVDCGIVVDEIVVLSVLSACANLVALTEGRLVHGLAVKIGIECYVNLQNACIHLYVRCGDIMSAEKLFDKNQRVDQISWNSMISGYMKCGFLEKARLLFDIIPERDVVTWSAMISGYAQHNLFPETLALFQKMLEDDIRPDETTMVSVISACTHMGALDQGKWVHSYIKQNGLSSDGILGTTLIDMYMKCGSVDDALEVFHMMEQKGVSAWNATILGLAVNGVVETALEMFSEMKKWGVIPNEITFIGVLGACRHSGLVEEGRKYFNSMVAEDKIEPDVRHYGCMVDLYGRAGLLKEAEELITSMPMEPDVTTWGALLGACNKHGDHEMGERVGRKLVELQPNNEGFNIILSNICASKGDWNDVSEIWKKMKQDGVAKTPGHSLIEANRYS